MNEFGRLDQELKLSYLPMIATGPLQPKSTPPTDIFEGPILGVDFSFRYRRWCLGELDDRYTEF